MSTTLRPRRALGLRAITVLSALLTLPAAALARPGDVPRPSTAADPLSPDLVRRLAAASPGDTLAVYLFLEEQAPIDRIRPAQKARGASRAEAHREVVTALMDAARSQETIRRRLDQEKGLGRVASAVPYWIANLIVVRATPDAIQSLAAQPGVAWIEPAVRARLIEPVSGSLESGAAGDSSASTQGVDLGAPMGAGVTDGVRAIRAPRVWHELGINGEGRLVANLDTGVDGMHPALASRWRGARPGSEPRHGWFDPADPASEFPVDTHGHGTHVLGTMAGLGATTNDSIGVAWGADWIASNGIQADTTPDGGDPIIAAFQWFADPDGDPATIEDVPDVVQNSWGVAPDEPGYIACEARWWEVIDHCEAAGVVVTWSAGNSGPASATMIVPADRASSPTNAFSIGAVMATGTSFPYTLAGFSSRGPSFCTQVEADRVKPEVVAPGVDVYSSLPGGVYRGGWSGTSMAGPHAAGIVALLRQANPDLDVDTIKRILMETARDLGRAGEDNEYGWGFVDAHAAVLRAMQDFGRVEGTVQNGSTGGTPIDRATVTLLDTQYRFRGDAEGRFRGAAAAAVYRAVAAASGFEPDTATIAIEPGETIDVQFSLFDNTGPAIEALAPAASTTDTLGPYSVIFAATDPSGVTTVAVRYRLGDGAWNDAPVTADLANEIPPTLTYRAILPGAPPGTRIAYFARATDGAALIGTWPPGGEEAPALLDVRRLIYRNGFEVAPDSAWIAGGTEDDAVAGWWVQADPVGATDGERLTQPEDDTTPEPGVLCFVTGNGSPGGAAGEADVDGGCTTLLSPIFDLSRENEVFAGFRYWFGMGGASSDDTLFIDVSADSGLTWRPLDRIATADTLWRAASYRLADSTSLTAGARLRIRACDLRQPGVLEAALDDFSLEALLPPRPRPTPPPPVTRLLPAVPNPSRGECAVRFELAEPARVRLTVYDVGGRRVRLLSDDRFPSGGHEKVWNGRDDQGHRAAAGVYYVRLESGGRQESRLVVLIPARRSDGGR